MGEAAWWVGSLSPTCKVSLTGPSPTLVEDGQLHECSALILSFLSFLGINSFSHPFINFSLGRRSTHRRRLCSTIVYQQLRGPKALGGSENGLASSELSSERGGSEEEFAC